TSVELGRDCDPVHTLGVWNVANDLAGIDIKHDSMRRVRYISPSRGRIDGDVIPTTLTTNLDFLQNLVSSCRGRCRSSEQKNEPESSAHRILLPRTACRSTSKQTKPEKILKGTTQTREARRGGSVTTPESVFFEPL